MSTHEARLPGEAGSPASQDLAPGTRPGRPDPLRSGSVVRQHLVERLIGHAGVPVVAVVAPGGYGKTTLLQQWAERDPRPFAWLRLTADDNDPTVLISGLALAIDPIVPVGDEVMRSFAAPRHSSLRTIARLVSVLDASSRPGVLVLEDAYRVDAVECHDMVAVLADSLPSHWQLAIASRRQLWLPIARLRAERRVVEIGADDLAMGDDEAAELIEAAGVALDRSDVVSLNKRAEGWPVALYLAALAAGSDGVVDGAEWGGGADRFMADYLLSEVLAGLPPSTVRFLTRTSLPERLCGSLCDALLDSNGSAERLSSLERENALVIPLDQERRWYRYHALLRELLSEELQRREPEHVAVFRRRAADWYEAVGSPELAIDEAMELEDATRVARMTAEHAQSFYQIGRDATIQRWFDWIDERNLMERYPDVAVTGALVHMLAGRAAAAARWMAVAERSVSVDDQSAASDPELQGDIAMLHAASCSEGPVRMRQDAADAVRLIPVGGPWRAASLMLLGTAHLLTDELDEAERILMEAVEVAEDARATIAASTALAELALVAERSGRSGARDALAERALGVVADNGLTDYATSALVLAVSGRILVDQGEAHRAKTLLGSAQRLRPHLTHALPIFAIQARLELARAYVAVTDVSGARTVLNEAGVIARRLRRPGRLVDEMTDLRNRLERLRVTMVGASSLTSAELRLLPLLSTNLTFRRIGERLFISPNTVKTQAISIYRKLGVSSRGEAVARAQELGLLGA